MRQDKEIRCPSAQPPGIWLQKQSPEAPQGRVMPLSRGCRLSDSHPLCSQTGAAHQSQPSTGTFPARCSDEVSSQP